MNKRGIERGILLKLIIGAISLVILIVVFTVVFYPKSSNLVSDYMCSGTLTLKSIFKSPELIFWGGDSPIPLSCKMYKSDIKGTENDMEIMKGIADQMSNCWWRLGEGKLDFYSDIQAPWTNNNVCFLCAEIRPKQKVSVDGQEFVNFLVSEKGRKTGDKTYAEFIIGSGLEEDQFIEGVGDLEFDDENALYVVFLINKDEELANRLLGIGSGAVAGGGTGAIAGMIAPGGGSIVGGGIGMVAGAIAAIGKGGGFNANIFAYSSDEIANVCGRFAT